MRARYGVSRVWVASDDDGTLAELRAADPSFQFLQLAGSRLPPLPRHFPTDEEGGSELFDKAGGSIPWSPCHAPYCTLNDDGVMNKRIINAPNL